MGFLDKLTADRSEKETYRADQAQTPPAHSGHAGSSSQPPAYPAAPAPLNMPSAGPAAGGSAFACLHLGRSDRVRLLGFTDDVVPAVNEAIQRVWMSGIQRAGTYEYGGYEWKLSGNPCMCTIWIRLRAARRVAVIGAVCW